MKELTPGLLAKFMLQDAKGNEDEVSGLIQSVDKDSVVYVDEETHITCIVPTNEVSEVLRVWNAKLKDVVKEIQEPVVEEKQRRAPKERAGTLAEQVRNLVKDNPGASTEVLVEMVIALGVEAGKAKRYVKGTLEKA